MSRATKGAALAAPALRPEDATPALADQLEAEALAGIENVQDPAEAERLLAKVKLSEDAVRLAKLGEDRERRWHVVRLKAERRYGVLLGEAEHGGDRRSDQVASRDLNKADRDARARARKVAAVPDDVFENYVANDPKPSREGLLRKAPDHKDRPRPRQRTEGIDLWENDDVLAWVARRMRAGRSRDEIMAESKAGRHDWPVPGKHLGQNATDRVRAILTDRKRRGDTNRRRQPKESGKRLRQLHAERRAGRTGGLWHLQKAIAEAVGMLEGFHLPDLDWSEETEALVIEIYDDLERHARWNDAAIDAVTAHMGDLARRRKINALRKRADDPSSTPSERASAARLADRLESKRNASQLGA